MDGVGGGSVWKGGNEGQRQHRVRAARGQSCRQGQRLSVIESTVFFGSIVSTVPRTSF